MRSHRLSDAIISEAYLDEITPMKSYPPEETESCSVTPIRVRSSKVSPIMEKADGVTSDNRSYEETSTDSLAGSAKPAVDFTPL